MVLCRLYHLVIELFLQPKKAPRLRAKGAVTRHLVPFVVEICDKYWANGNSHQKTVLSLIQDLGACYSCLDVFNAELLASSCRRFALTLVALEEEALSKAPSTKRWRVKPKLHLFQELCEFVVASKGNPRLFWCYRDEDWGGELQTMSGSRGGPSSARRTAENMLLRFMCVTPLPVLSP